MGVSAVVEAKGHLIKIGRALAVSPTHRERQFLANAPEPGPPDPHCRRPAPRPQLDASSSSSSSQLKLMSRIGAAW